MAVNFGAQRKKIDSVRNFFRCSGTFNYKGRQGIVDKRPRIYFVSSNKSGLLDLSGWIEYQEDIYRNAMGEGSKIVRQRQESVHQLANYGLLDGNFIEVMQNSVYAMHLLGTDISSLLAQFERHGTTFHSFNIMHIILDDIDDVQFRSQVLSRDSS